MEVSILTKLGLRLFGSNDPNEIEVWADEDESSGSQDEDGESESEDGEEAESEDGEEAESEDGGESEEEDGEGDESEDGDDSESGGESEDGGESEGDESEDGGESEDAEKSKPEEFEGNSPLSGGDPSPGKKEEGSQDSDPSAEGVLAEDLLEALEKNPKLLDNNQALAQALASSAEDEAKSLQNGEQVWKPASTQDDQVLQVSVSRGTGGDRTRKTAAALRDAVKGEVSSLTSKMRTKFLQARTPQTVHGVKKGNALSERRLVDSFVEMKSGYRPTRPDWSRTEKDDVSLACAVVLDESGSMSNLVLEVGKAALAVAEPLSNLGSPCLVIGPRNAGNGVKSGTYYSGAGCHRTGAVTIDVFKDWDEKISQCWERFGRVQATGSTPLEDGIQYALRQISNRPERHRVILVVTDGSPDNPNVVRYQIRQAKEAGITIVGVGIDYGCYEVKRLFPEHVAVSNISELPNELLRILNGIVFPARAKRVNFDAPANP